MKPSLNSRGSVEDIIEISDSEDEPSNTRGEQSPSMQFDEIDLILLKYLKDVDMEPDEVPIYREIMEEEEAKQKWRLQNENKLKEQRRISASTGSEVEIIELPETDDELSHINDEPSPKKLKYAGIDKNVTKNLQHLYIQKSANETAKDMRNQKRKLINDAPKESWKYSIFSPEPKLQPKSNLTRSVEDVVDLSNSDAEPSDTDDGSLAKKLEQLDFDNYIAKVLQQQQQKSISSAEEIIELSSANEESSSSDDESSSNDDESSSSDDKSSYDGDESSNYCASSNNDDTSSNDDESSNSDDESSRNDSDTSNNDDESSSTDDESSKNGDESSNSEDESANNVNKSSKNDYQSSKDDESSSSDDESSSNDDESSSSDDESSCNGEGPSDNENESSCNNNESSNKKVKF